MADENTGTQGSTEGQPANNQPESTQGNPAEAFYPNQGGTPTTGNEGDGKAGQGDKGADQGQGGSQSKEGEPQGGEKGKDGDGKAEGDQAPAYEDFQVPEGMELDHAALEQFTPIAQELGLNQEQAQQLVSLYATRVQEQSEGQAEAWQQQLDSWVDEIKSDEQIGGRNFDQSMQAASKAMDQFATPELRSFLDESGLGNHPELVRLMARIGKEIGEDTIVSPPGSSGTQQPAGDQTYAEVLYGGGGGQ